MSSNIHDDEPIRLKMGSGAYGFSFDIEKRKLSLDFSGNSSFMGGPVECYRNDSQVMLFVAHSYQRSFATIEQKLIDAIDNKREDEARHLMLPYFFLFRHYQELELKSFFMGVKGLAPSRSHNLNKLCNEFLNSVKDLSFDKEIAGVSDLNEFEQHKRVVLELIQSLHEEIVYFKAYEPADDYFRFLYSKKFKLAKHIIDFEYSKQVALFHRIIVLNSKIEHELWYLVNYNRLMG